MKERSPKKLKAKGTKGAVGRPRKAAPGEQTIDKRAQILKGALVAFLEYGFAGTSVDKITEEAGVSKQTIYSYFSSKEELFVALIDQMVSNLTGSGITPQLLASDTPTLLRKSASLMLDKLGSFEYVSFLRLLIGESARFPELTERYIKTVIQPGQQLLTFYFDKMIDLPDAETAAWMFNGALIAYIIRQEVLQAKHTMTMPRERYINGIVDILMYASQEHQRLK